MPKNRAYIRGTHSYLFRCLRVFIPDASVLKDLTNDLNFFAFSFFRGQSGSGLSFSNEKILVTCFQYASLMLF